MVPVYHVTIHAKMATPDFHRYPLRLCMIKYYLDIHVFVSFNCLFSSVVSLKKWLPFLLVRSNREMIRMKHFSSRETSLSSTFMIRLKFQGYLCKSGITIFVWRVTWNYAFSSFEHYDRLPFPQFYVYIPGTYLALLWFV